MKEKILWGIAVVGLVLGGISFLGSAQGARVVSLFGATAGNMLAENYIPYVLYNGGYNSAKPIATTDDLLVGGGEFVLTTSNTATSSATIGCIQQYATSTATAVRITFGTAANATSTTQGTNASGTVVWQYGSCPI